MQILLALVFTLNSLAAAAAPLASRLSGKYDRLDRCQATLRATIEVDGYWVPVNIDHYQHSIKIKRSNPASGWPTRRTPVAASQEDFWKYTVDDVFVLQNRLFALIENQRRGTGSLSPTLIEWQFKARDIYGDESPPFFAMYPFLVGGLTAATIYHRIGIPQSGAALYIFAGSVAAVPTALIQFSAYLYRVIQTAKRKVIFDRVTVISGEGQGARSMNVLRDPVTGLVKDVVLQPGYDERERYLLSQRLAEEAHARELLPPPAQE